MLTERTELSGICWCKRTLWINIKSSKSKLLLRRVAINASITTSATLLLVGITLRTHSKITKSPWETTSITTLITCPCSLVYIGKTIGLFFLIPLLHTSSMCMLLCDSCSFDSSYRLGACPCQFLRSVSIELWWLADFNWFASYAIWKPLSFCVFHLCCD